MSVNEQEKLKGQEAPTEWTDKDRETEVYLWNLSTNVETWALEQEIMLNHVRDLLQSFQSLKSWIKSSEWNWATKRQLKHWLNENIENLKNIRTDLWWDNESLKDTNKQIKIKKDTHIYTDLSTYKWRIWELEYYFSHYEQVRQIIVLGGRTSEIHAIIDSIQDAKRSKYYEEKDNKYQQRMNEILHDPAITSLRNDDMERYEEYLKKVINWEIEPSSHPFYNTHCQSFRMIQQINPSLYKILAPNRRKITQNTVPVVLPTTWAIIEWIPATVTVGRTNQPESFSSKFGKWFSEVLSNIFPKMENNPRQKKAWEQFGTVAALGWSIFMWYKVLKNIFSKKADNPNKRGKAAWWWTALIALFNGDKIIDWWKDALNIHPAERIQASNEILQTYWFSDSDASRITEMYIWAPMTTMWALSFIPIYELTSQEIITFSNNKPHYNFDKYQNYIENYEWTPEQKEILIKTWKKLNDEILSSAFLTLNITEEYLRQNQDKKLSELPEVQNRILNNREVSSWVNSELYKQWLKAKNAETARTIILEYNQNWWNDISKDKLKELMIKWMKDWLLEINDSEKKYEIEDLINNENIDLENKTIKWLTNSWWMLLEFESYKELFDTMHLTQWIKKNFKWRPAINEAPFHIAVWWRVEFDDTERYKAWKNETDVLKNRTLSKTSSLLWKNKQFYVDYLNNRRKEEGKNKYDLEEYPIIKTLSELWIQFTDKEEIQKTEQRLNDIQNGMKYFIVWPEWYKPYSIERNKLIFTTSDTESAKKLHIPDDLPETFPDQHWTIDDYPTISKNKDKFLEFMNDKDNKMRWREISESIDS